MSQIRKASVAFCETAGAFCESMHWRVTGSGSPVSRASHASDRCSPFRPGPRTGKATKQRLAPSNFNASVKSTESCWIWGKVTYLVEFKRRKWSSTNCKCIKLHATGYGVQVGSEFMNYWAWSWLNTPKIGWWRLATWAAWEDFSQMRIEPCSRYVSPNLFPLPNFYVRF